jgi:hypothetical protein
MSYVIDHYCLTTAAATYTTYTTYTGYVVRSDSGGLGGGLGARQAAGQALAVVTPVPGTSAVTSQLRAIQLKRGALLVTFCVGVKVPHNTQISRSSLPKKDLPFPLLFGDRFLTFFGPKHEDFGSFNEQGVEQLKELLDQGERFTAVTHQPHLRTIRAIT